MSVSGAVMPFGSTMIGFCPTRCGREPDRDDEPSCVPRCCDLEDAPEEPFFFDGFIVSRYISRMFDRSLPGAACRMEAELPTGISQDRISAVLFRCSWSNSADTPNPAQDSTACSSLRALISASDTDPTSATAADVAAADRLPTTVPRLAMSFALSIVFGFFFWALDCSPRPAEEDECLRLPSLCRCLSFLCLCRFSRLCLSGAGAAGRVVAAEAGACELGAAAAACRKYASTIGLSIGFTPSLTWYCLQTLR
mmetsp:Transcript_1988/g.4904  ORF Transcript_1988/g.4904 Transcript_1988/m.4904 type:complete len:253 (+) Transcript_1988:740-1498(+)